MLKISHFTQVLFAAAAKQHSHVWVQYYFFCYAFVHIPHETSLLDKQEVIMARVYILRRNVTNVTKHRTGVWEGLGRATGDQLFHGGGTDSRGTQPRRRSEPGSTGWCPRRCLWSRRRLSPWNLKHRQETENKHEMVRFEAPSDQDTLRPISWRMRDSEPRRIKYHGN